LPVGSGDDKNYGIATYTDGTLTSVGYSYNGTNYDFATVRWLSNGVLDTSFNTSGKATTGITTNQDDVAYGIFMQSDGKAMVGGYTYNGSNNDFAVVRFFSDGTLDTAFNTSGKTTLAVNNAEDTANAIAKLGSYIYVAGQTNSGTLDFALARYGTNGVVTQAG